jgi:coenzyme F420-0:L-glutamate ligase/coenzyme F420-1:gamma-L-glutamate ligase
LLNVPIIEEGDNVGKIILECYAQNKLEVQEKDIIIIAQTIISRAEGAIIDLKKVKPSIFAQELARKTKKDPRLVEQILREAKNICKNRNGVLVTETKHGFVCANSGVDFSNTPGENVISLLPKNPDKSAKNIRKYIEEKTENKVAIVISDTHCRPFRLGAINIAIGCSGINPLKNYKGKNDLFGYQLKSSTIAQADQICSAAGLIMGEAAEGKPIIIIKGYSFTEEEISAKKLIRPEEKDYFR